jgi:DNA polymerase-3 subunit alpha (Gram-positive type)
MSEFYKELSQLKFCVFDLETTGGNQERDYIIEIGIVLIDNLKITKEKNFLLKPGIKIPEFIQKLTSISNNDVKNCPKIEDVIEEILIMMDDRILVAHNTSFDVPFFNSVLRRLHKSELNNKSICTNLMSKFLIPNLLNTNLSYMSQLFKINHGKAHRALDDAKATAEIFLIYLNIFKNRKIEKLNHLYYPKNKFEIDRCTLKMTEGFSIQNINLLSPALLTAKGEKGVILYSMPLLSLSKNTETLINERLDSNIKTITIQYFGSFFESFYQFILSIMKLKKSLQDQIIEDYCSLYGIDLEKLRELSEDIQSSPRKLKNQFLVAPHLVENQLVIFNLSTISLRNFSAFKITAHRKKLIQFINSRVSRAKSSKPNSTFMIQAIIQLQVELIKNKDKYLASYDSMGLESVNGFVNEIEDYSLEQEYPYNYPKKYI